MINPQRVLILAYRTRIGNDVEGQEYGYKIHILYNVFANPESYSFDTMARITVHPIEFGWSFDWNSSKT